MPSKEKPPVPKSSASGSSPPAIAELNDRIRQLGRRRILELPQMLDFHTWLDGKRLARQSCRVA